MDTHTLTLKIAAEMASFLRDMKTAEKHLDLLAQAGQQVQNALGGLFAGLSVGVAVGKLVEVQREFDKLYSTVKVLTGSQAAAEREMQWIKDFAANTPYGLAQATQGFVKLKALGLDPSRAALTSYGNTAAAMGKDLMQFIEAVADASTSEFERLKEFGIKAKQNGDSVALTFQGVTKTIGNNASEIVQYLESIGNNQFAGTMAERAKTLDGALANLGDTVDEVFRTVSSLGIGGTLADGARLASDSLTDLISILQALENQTKSASDTSVSFKFTQEAVAVIFETVVALGANVKYVLVQIGNELGGLAAQAVQLAQLNLTGAAAIRAQMIADSEAARKEVDATTARILNARALQAAIDKGKGADEPMFARLLTQKKLLGDLFSPDVEKRLRQHYIKPQKEASKTASEEAKIIAELSGVTASYQEDLTRLGAIREKGIITEAQYIELVEQLIAKQPGAKKQIDEMTKAQEAGWKVVEARNKAVEEAAKLEAQYQAAKDAQAFDDAWERDQQALRTIEDRIKAGRTMLEQMQFENSLLTMTSQQRAIATAEREMERQGIVKGTEAYIAYADAIKQAVLDKEAITEAQNFWSSIEQTAHGVWVDVANGGESAFRKIGQTLKAAVLDVLWQMTGRKWLINIGASMGVPGAALAQQQMGGMASSAGGSALGGMAGDVLGALGTGLGSGFGMIAGGGIGGWLTASTSLIGTGTAAGAMAGLGALAGPIGAVLAIGSLLKSLDDSGTMHTGGLGSYSKAGGTAVGDVVKGQSPGFFGLASADYQSSTEQASVKIAQSIVGILDSTAATFGQQAGYYAATAFADDTSKDGAWGGLTIKLADKIVADWGSGGEGFLGKVFADGEKGAKEYSAAVGKTVRDTLMEQTPQWADTMLKALGDSPSLEQLGETVGQINDLQKQLNKLGIGSLFEDITKEGAAGARVLRTDLVPWMQRLANQGGPTAETLKSIAEYPNSLLELAGTSRDNLVKIYTDGFMSGDVAGAGQAVADTLVASIEQTIVGTAAGQIFDTINRGIVTPIIDAMLTGQTLSEALSQASIDAAINKAKEQAEALSAIYNDPRFKELLSGLKTTLGGALGSAGASFTYTPQYQQQTSAANNITDAAKEAADAAEEARKEWQDITDGLLGTKSDLLIEELRAQGREEDALALERERAIKGMDAYQVGLYDSNQQLQTQIDLLNKTNAQRAEYESLGVELLRAQGRETEALAAQRRIDVAGMTDVEIALYDLNAARRAEIDSIAKNKEALDAFWTAADSTAERYLSKDVLTSYRFDRVAQQINTATGSTGITGALLSGLGVDDIKNAVASFVSSDAPLTAKTQIIELGAALLGLGDAARTERQSLQDRLNAATDTNAQALARQRAALDESNRALFDQVIAAEKAKAVGEQRKTLQDELNALTDTNAQALARQRAALDESNRALFDQVQAAKLAKAAEEERKGLLDRLYSLTDTNTQALTRQRDALDASNRALFDEITALEQAKAAREQRLGIENQLLQALGMTAEIRRRELEALHPANRALQERLYALQDSRTATDTSYAALERAVAAQRKQADTARQAASDLVSEVASIFDILKSSVRELYGEVEQTRAMGGVQGMAFIDAALTAARAAGVLPDANDLRDAISGVRGTFGGDQFASQVDADFNRLVLAGKLAELEKISGGQLTNAEQQLASLERANDQYDEMLASYKRQIDTMRGVDTRVLGVGDAIAELQLAMSTEQQITATTMLDVFGAQYDVLLSIDAGIAALNDKQQAAKAASAAVAAAAKTANVGHTTSPWAQYIAQTTGPSAREDAIRFALENAKLFGQGNAFVGGAETHMGRIAGAGSVSITSGGGVSINDLAAKLLGITDTDTRLTQYDMYAAWLQAELDKLPKFAAGGYHTGGWAMVGEQGPELAYMPPAHIVNAADTRQIMSSDGGAVVAAKIDSLERTVASLLSVIAGNTQRTATVLSDVTDSGTAMRLGETIS